MLVVIGILLAFQIDKWNQNRKEENTIKEYAVSLIHALEEAELLIRLLKETYKD